MRISCAHNHFGHSFLFLLFYISCLSAVHPRSLHSRALGMPQEGPAPAYLPLVKQGPLTSLPYCAMKLAFIKLPKKLQKQAPTCKASWSSTGPFHYCLLEFPSDMSLVCAEGSRTVVSTTSSCLINYCQTLPFSRLEIKPAELALCSGYFPPIMPIPFSTLIISNMLP